MNRAVLGLVFLASAFHVPAQVRYTIEGTAFLPSTFYVGDHVELRLRLRTGAELRKPETLPEVPWGYIHDLRIDRRGDLHELRLFFTAFVPGLQSIPRIRLGGLTLDEQKINVGSLLEEGFDRTEPPRPQLYLPGTEGLLAVLIVSGLSALALVVVSLRWGRNYLRAVKAAYRRRYPGRRLKRALGALAGEAGSVSSRDFYYKLLCHVRDYLSLRLDRNYFAYTTKETVVHLESTIADDKARADLRDLLRFADEVKFGGREAQVERRRRDIDLLRNIDQFVASEGEARVQH